MKIDMPDEGWGLHVQEVYCPLCDAYLRQQSLYRHPDLWDSSMSLELHNNDEHHWTGTEWVHRRWWQRRHLPRPHWWDPIVTAIRVIQYRATKLARP